MIENFEEKLSKMTEQEIIDLYNKKKDDFMLDDVEIMDTVEYTLLWETFHRLESQTTYDENDKVRYPDFGWIDYSLDKNLSFLNGLTTVLNSINGIKASGGTVYKKGTYRNAKINWHIMFDDIASLNHFLWGGCRRYFCLSKNNKWLLHVDVGDPKLNEEKICMELSYMNIEAKREEWEYDVKVMTKHLKSYAEEGQIMINQILNKNKENGLF